MWNWFKRTPKPTPAPELPPAEINSELEREARQKLQSLLDDLRKVGDIPVIVGWMPGQSDFDAMRMVLEAAEKGATRIIVVEQRPSAPPVDFFQWQMQTRLEKALKTLLDFLNLPPQERAFVRHLTENPQDGDTLAVFADWLEEHNRVEVGQRLRMLR